MTSPVIPASFGPRQAQPLDALMPDARSIINGLFQQVDPRDLPLDARIAIERKQRVAAIAARIFMSAEGREVLEALCDATVRRPATLIAPGVTPEFAGLYAAKREGQNDTLYLLLAWIAEGRSEQPPTREPAA